MITVSLDIILLKAASLSAAKKDIRPALNGVYVDLNDRNLHATNGHLAFMSRHKRELSETQIINLLYHLVANKLNSWYERNIIFEKAVAELATVPLGDWLSKQTIQALAKNNVTHFGQIRQLGRERLAQLKGIGEKRMIEIYHRFHDMAVELQENLPHFIQFQMDEVHRDETLDYFKKLGRK